MVGDIDENIDVQHHLGFDILIFTPKTALVYDRILMLSQWFYDLTARSPNSTQIQPLHKYN